MELAANVSDEPFRSGRQEKNFFFEPLCSVAFVVVVVLLVCLSVSVSSRCAVESVVREGGVQTPHSRTRSDNRWVNTEREREREREKERGRESERGHGKETNGTESVTHTQILCIVIFKVTHTHTHLQFHHKGGVSQRAIFVLVGGGEWKQEGGRSGGNGWFRFFRSVRRRRQGSIFAFFSMLHLPLASYPPPPPPHALCVPTVGE